MLRRPMAALGLVFLVLAAGCTVALPQPVVPTRPGYAWSATESRIWVVRVTHCGFCAQYPPEGAHELMALHYDGSLLDVQYNLGEPLNGTDYKVAFANDTWARWDAQLRSDWQATFGQAPVLVHVVGMDAKRLNVADSEYVLQTVQGALQQVRDPGRRASSCADCPIQEYHLFRPPVALNATLGQPVPTGAWTVLDAQMGLLHDWMRHQPPPQHPIM